MNKKITVFLLFSSLSRFFHIKFWVRLGGCDCWYALILDNTRKAPKCSHHRSWLAICHIEFQSTTTGKMMWLDVCCFITVSAPIYFICPSKFSNSALLFGSYFCCVGLRVIVFFNFCAFCSTLYFRHNAQLFWFLPSSSVLVFHFILGSEAIGRFILQVFVTRHRYFILFCYLG